MPGSPRKEEKADDTANLREGDSPQNAGKGIQTFSER